MGVWLAAATLLMGASDPWTAGDVTRPDDFVSQVKSGHAPAMRMVGPRIIYNGDHITGAMYAGPANTAAGIDALLKSVEGLPVGTPLLIYCGCCPMDRCPNIRPAFAALKKAGFGNVKVLVLDTNLHSDWTEKGYPVEKGTIAKP
jgi:thiosulfate/3-mercaptopyruvate sulfurtransferase